MDVVQVLEEQAAWRRPWSEKCSRRGIDAAAALAAIGHAFRQAECQCGPSRYVTGMGDYDECNDFLCMLYDYVFLFLCS